MWTLHWVKSKRAILALIIALTTTVGAQPSAPTDTTIAGRSYTLLEAGELMDLLGTASDHSRLALRQTAVKGRLSSLAANLDTVRAALELTDVLFLDEVLLAEVVFLGPVIFSRTTFAADLSLAEAQFLQSFALRECEVRQKTNLRDARFTATADFTQSHLAAVFSCAGAHFSDATFARLRCEGGAYFEDVLFAGQVDFSDARFAGVASFKTARWRAPVSFAGARFLDRSFFWQAQFAAADFSSVRFAGETSFKQAAFAHRAVFANIAFAHSAHFEQARFDDGAVFDGSIFAKEAVFTGVHSDNDLLLNALFRISLDLRHLVAPSLDLRPSATMPDSLLGPGAQLLLQNARFQRLFSTWDHLRGHLAQPPEQANYDLDRVYAGLRHQFLISGMAADARGCYIESLDRRRHHLPWTSTERYALIAFDLSSRYGTDLERLALVALVWVALFALLYRWLLIDDRRLPLVECLLFSLHTFFIAGAASVRPHGKLRFLVLFQALSGWLFWGLCTAVLLSFLLR